MAQPTLTSAQPLSDHDGMLVTWLRGFQSEKVLREIIDIIDPATCTDT